VVGVYDDAPATCANVVYRDVLIAVKTSFDNAMLGRAGNALLFIVHERRVQGSDNGLKPSVRPVLDASVYCFCRFQGGFHVGCQGGWLDRGPIVSIIHVLALEVGPAACWQWKRRYRSMSVCGDYPPFHVEPQYKAFPHLLLD
jgi:hypothetical protein